MSNALSTQPHTFPEGKGELGRTDCSTTQGMLIVIDQSECRTDRNFAATGYITFNFHPTRTSTQHDPSSVGAWNDISEYKLHN